MKVIGCLATEAAFSQKIESVFKYSILQGVLSGK